MTEAHGRRDFGGGFAQQSAYFWDFWFGKGAGGRGDSDHGHRFSKGILNGRSNAARAEHIFFLVDRISLVAGLLNVGEYGLDGTTGVGRVWRQLQRATERGRIWDAVGQEDFSRGGAVQIHQCSGARGNTDRVGAVAYLYKQRFVAIEDGDMR